MADLHVKLQAKRPRAPTSRVRALKSIVGLFACMRTRTTVFLPKPPILALHSLHLLSLLLHLPQTTVVAVTAVTSVPALFTLYIAVAQTPARVAQPATPHPCCPTLISPHPCTWPTPTCLPTTRAASLFSLSLPSTFPSQTAQTSPHRQTHLPDRLRQFH